MMTALPAPYERYVYCSDTESLFSTKTYKFTKLVPAYNARQQKCWNVSTSKYNTVRIIIDDVIKMLPRGIPYNANNGGIEYMAIAYSKDGKQEPQIVTNTVKELLDRDVLKYVRHGYDVRLYTFVGTYKIIPESLIVE